MIDTQNFLLYTIVITYTHFFHKKMVHLLFLQTTKSIQWMKLRRR